ncbi:SanA/YdcF family protein [Brumimicrobium aurantiacum]|uniref:SanA/YdcF family protein n=1 Tax=Brumimicrobium aurantiacum TaxID=1737063 RepID=UPI001F0C85C2|nr:ElyC/SanA/YdcF family protein [Brumimicrobium aurantiacum]
MRTKNRNIFKRKGRLILIVIFASLLFAGLFGYFSNVIVENSAENKTFDDVNKISQNRVGVVLGTAKYRAAGGINLYFKFRIDAAVQLYKNGKIDFILVSGDNSTKYYNEPASFKEELIKNGVPAAKIFLDYAGFRTLDSVVRALKVFGQNKITIISQKFHNERAIYLASKNGINAIGFNAKDVGHNYGLKTKIREYFARSKAILDVVFGVEPKFLGEPIRIH